MRSNAADFRIEVEKALAGRSVAGTATAAGLPRNAIRNVLNGHDPKLSRVAQICDALDLELYIGPRRDGAALAPPSPIDVLATGPGAAAGRSGATADLGRTIQRSAWELVRAALGLGHNPIPPDLWPVVAAHHGETLPPGNNRVEAEAAPVEVIELAAAAGEGGSEVLYEERKGLVWFRRGWLERRGLNPDDCMVIGVTGESMAPTLPSGCTVLVDRASTDWKPPRILVVRTAAGLVAKRAATGDDGARIMASDNPYWPAAPLPEDAEIVGRIRWMAHGLE